VDAENKPLTAELISSPSHGSLTLKNDGSFVYIPYPDFNGADSFTYIANDSWSDSNVATVIINFNSVNDIPVANDDNAITDEDNEVWINVLENDSDVDGILNPSTVTIINGPTNGYAIINTTTGEIRYTPDSDFFGDDSFSYTVDDYDGTASNEASVNIKIEGVACKAETGATSSMGSQIIFDLSKSGDIIPPSVMIETGVINMVTIIAAIRPFILITSH